LTTNFKSHQYDHIQKTKVIHNFLYIFSSLVFLLPNNLVFRFMLNKHENPREANGRIVCANCHLAQKPTEYESPTSVLPDSVLKQW
jgi:hypothetical protein